jgi:hypothetical protein
VAFLQALTSALGLFQQIDGAGGEPLPEGAAAGEYAVGGEGVSWPRNTAFFKNGNLSEFQIKGLHICIENSKMQKTVQRG